MSNIRSIGQVAAYKPISRCGMEELAVWQTTAKPTGGVLFARNVDGEEKSAARQIILDLFLPDVWGRKLNMLTMPGVHWRFERKLLGMREAGWMRTKSPHRTHFTGVENDRSIFFASTTQMPGLNTPGALIKPVKRERFPFAEAAVKTRYASFFFANIDEMMQHQWNQAPYREQEQAGWDAAWLDYTGPLTLARMNVISRFFHCFVRSTLIVTALKARWDRETSDAVTNAGGHSEWLRKHLPGEVLHDIEYFDTSPMAQFAVRKEPT